MGKIVVGIDGSDVSKAALRWALAEAQLRHATVEAVHAWLPLPIVASDVAPVPGQASAAELIASLPPLQDAAEQLVRRAVEEVASDASVEVEGIAVEGPAAQVLIDRSRTAELIVVGSRGHGGFVGLLLGSVSFQVAHHAMCPVVIHRQPSQQ
jgi:nucleotide-binding universal stress UspA family protein